MNIHLGPGSGVVILIVVILWVLYRKYKKVSRRCPAKGCGKLHVKRRHFIMLPLEEMGLQFQLRSPTSGKFRWFVRRALKLTFTDCDGQHGHKRRIRLVKIDMDPISLWHLWWTKWFHREEYDSMPMGYTVAINELLHQVRANGTIEPGGDEDTPPLKPMELLKIFFGPDEEPPKK